VLAETGHGYFAYAPIALGFLLAIQLLVIKDGNPISGGTPRDS
jgi:hypothetical protein